MESEDFRTEERIDQALVEVMRHRRREHTEGFTLIGSENHPHPEDVAAYRDAQKAGFDGGYFEGYPADLNKRPGSGRFYQGCLSADELERLARDRVVRVIARSNPDAAEANVQAPSGAIANIAAYLGVLEPGDKIVAPDLKDGYGHLSYGAGSPNVVSKLFNVRSYGVDPATHLLDYVALEQTVKEHQPKLIIGGASSYTRDIDWKYIVTIAKAYGALTMADISHPAGLVVIDALGDPFANGVDIVTSTTHKTLRGEKGAVIVWRKDLAERMKTKGINFSVFPGMLGGPNMATVASIASTFRRAQTPQFKQEQLQTKTNAETLARALEMRGWQLITGGTDNHLVLADVTKIDGLKADANKDGWNAAVALETGIGIITNKNSIPRTEGTPIRPVGLRMGTPAMTARGLQETEVRDLADCIDQGLRYANDAMRIAAVRTKVRDMAYAFPAPTYE